MHVIDNRIIYARINALFTTVTTSLMSLLSPQLSLLSRQTACICFCLWVDEKGSGEQRGKSPLSGVDNCPLMASDKRQRCASRILMICDVRVTSFTPIYGSSGVAEGVACEKPSTTPKSGLQI